MTNLPHHNKKDEKKESGAEGLGLSPDLLDLLAKFQEIELEDFQMEVGEMELSFTPGMFGQAMPTLKLPPALKAKPVNMLKA